jgi:hypothetical protein
MWWCGCGYDAADVGKAEERLVKVPEDPVKVRAQEEIISLANKANTYEKVDAEVDKSILNQAAPLDKNANVTADLNKAHDASGKANLNQVDDTPGKADLNQAHATSGPSPDLYQDRRFQECLAQTGEAPLHLGPRRPTTDLKDLTLDRYTASHQEKFSKLLTMEPMEGWNFKTEQDGAKVYVRQDPDSPLFQFKSICEVACSKGLGYIIQSLAAVEERTKWDEMVIQSRNVEAHAPFYRVSYTQLESPSPLIIARRDILLIGRVRFEPDGGALLQIQSIADPEYPETAGFVRADMIYGGYIIRPTSKPDVFLITWTGVVNPNGWIPSWVANAVAWKQGLTLPKFAKHLQSKMAKSK